MWTFDVQFGLTQDFGCIHGIVALIILHHIGQFPVHGASDSERLSMLRRSVEKYAFIGTCRCLARIEHNTILALRTRIKNFGELVLLAKHGKIFLLQFFSLELTWRIESKKQVNIASHIGRRILDVLHRINLKEFKVSPIFKDSINVLRAHDLFALAQRFGHTIIHDEA